MSLLTRQASIGSLKGINPDLSGSAEESDTLLLSSEVIRKGKCSRKKIRNVVTLLTIWTAYLLVSAAYSIIAPFYPQEVSVFDCVSEQKYGTPVHT